MIGVGILLGVIFYNIFRSRSKGRSQFGKEDLSSFKNTSQAIRQPSQARVEPGFARFEKIDSVVSPSQIETSPQTFVNALRIDPAIDCSVVLHFSVPISGAEVLSHFVGWPKSLPFRYLVEGLKMDSEPSELDSWSPIIVGSSYTQLQVAIQLANRRGPIGVVDLSEFLTRCQLLAEHLDAEIDLPPVNEVLEQANLLDQFCVSSDIQLGFMLAANMISWSASDVQVALQKRGLILSRDGNCFNSYDQDQLNFKVQADGINFLLDDLQGKRVKQIQFLLDVPVVSIKSDPFMGMLAMAKQLAIDLDGRLLDDNGQALVDASIDGIQAYLSNLYELMKARDITPGSQSAIRLYS